MVRTLSRRSLLLAGAGTLVLAACGDGDDGGSSAGTGGATSEGASGLTLARVFVPEQPAGVPIRLPLALADGDGALLADVPERLEVRIGPVGGELGAATVVVRHSDGVPRPYFPFPTTFPTPGQWRIAADADGRTAETTVEAKGPGEVPAVPGVGERMVRLPTPTAADPLGIDPICTAEPVCPLHEVSLDAVPEGRATALLISTPRFCQTAICGPVLDLLVAARATHPEVTMVHAEVYRDESARQTAPAVVAYGLTFEPSLVVADATGTITARLDYTFDRSELDTALTGAVA
jgi:hypothetical protein